MILLRYVLVRTYARSGPERRCCRPCSPQTINEGPLFIYKRCTICAKDGEFLCLYPRLIWCNYDDDDSTCIFCGVLPSRGVMEHHEGWRKSVLVFFNFPGSQSEYNDNDASQIFPVEKLFNERCIILTWRINSCLHLFYFITILCYYYKVLLIYYLWWNISHTHDTTSNLRHT